MPKAVDIYVLDKKIGSGQFGDVFRGYSKVDGTDVAIKTINRSKIKGKFTQLLQNQIKVLRSCKNNNIIRLLDIKKTANNIYLVLQYCNEGDLGAYLKTKKKIPEDQAIQYFVQILHAFETLVNNKIMHRDFKLPNVLKHNGVIKLADFGFAKLLRTEDQQVQTILGSPLNMAPQVLDKQTYNNKADIWSIGVGFYEMVFGKVPYTASNIIDLLKRIRKQPLQFPSKVNPVIEDVIRKMLTVDPAKRIEWKDLFRHPITNYLQARLQQSLQESMHCEKGDFRFNMSKFYIKTNLVIQHPYDIQAKEELNNHIRHMMKNESPEKFSGNLIKRNKLRAEIQKQKLEDTQTRGTEKQIKEQNQDENSQISKKQYLQQIFKTNWVIILHQRNLYAFLGHLSEQILQYSLNIYGQCLAFLIVQKIIAFISKLKRDLHQHKLAGIKEWEVYEASNEHKKIYQLIEQQENIFNKLYEKLTIKVLEKGTLSAFEEDLMLSGKFTKQQTQKRIYVRVLSQYFNRITKDLKSIVETHKAKLTKARIFRHINKLIDSVNYEQIFEIGFSFAHYYDQMNKSEEESKAGRDKFILRYQQFMVQNSK